MSEFKEAIRSMIEDKGISQELVLDTIKQTLLATYKRKFGQDDNAKVVISDDLESVQMFAVKTVVDESNYYNEITEIPLDEAKLLIEEADIGDTIEIPLDLKNFDRISVMSGKQRAHQTIREIQKDELLSEFKKKQGEIINGYVQSKRDNGDLLIDLGRTQGILPKRNQSPREVYNIQDKVRCYVEKVSSDERNDRNIRVLLSRVHENFVRKLFEIYVPEIVAKDPSVEIMNIVRAPGYRTKVSVYPKRVDVDAVGTCVGLKGNRIQSIMSEMDGERIDVVKWDPDPATYIANALSPAQVDSVYIIDDVKKSAIAVVDSSQLSLAIGKQGLNVRLVNRLCDWMVDVKTPEQFADLDISRSAKAAADAIFTESQPENAEDEYVEDFDGEMPLTDLPLEKDLIEKLNFYDIYSVEEFINIEPEDFEEMNKLSQEEIDFVNKVISENVDIVENEDEETEESFACPNCGQPVTIGMTECPHCHVGLSFEEVEDEE